WRVRYLGDVHTTHVGGASTPGAVSPLSLLEGEVRVRLIRERGGPVRAALARPALAVRSLARTGIALLGSALPGLGPLRARRPKAFEVRLHARHLLWALAPPGAARRMLRAVGEDAPPTVPGSAPGSAAA